MNKILWADTLKRCKCRYSSNWPPLSAPSWWLPESISLPRLKAATCQTHPFFQINSQNLKEERSPHCLHHCKHELLDSSTGYDPLSSSFLLTLKLSGLSSGAPQAGFSPVHVPQPNLLSTSSHSHSTICSRLSHLPFPGPGSATSQTFLVPLRSDV